jgi:histidine triad (HIT) family protein
MSASHPECAFCRIIAGTAPGTQTYADADVVVIRDLHPQAPVHLLVLPRRHIPSIAASEAEDGALLARLVSAANRVARESGVAEGGYRLVINTGNDAGQSVSHLHIHVLGGRHMGWPPG